MIASFSNLKHHLESSAAHVDKDVTCEMQQMLWTVSEQTGYDENWRVETMLHLKIKRKQVQEKSKKAEKYR